MLALIYTLVPWIGPILGVVGSQVEGMTVLEFFLTPDGAGMGFFGLAATVIVLCVTFFGAIEEIDNSFLFFIAGLGIAADIVCLILPYHEQIVRWCKTDGKGQFPVYLGILLAVILLSIISHRVKKKQGNPEMPLFKLPVTLYFLIPSLVMYIYDGLDMELHMGELVPNLDILGWRWNMKVTAVVFLILALKFFISVARQDGSFFWIAAAHFGKVVVFCFLYVLLERSIYPISYQGLSTTILLFIPMTLVPAFFHLFSYLSFLNLFLPGTFRSLRLQKEEEAAQEADKEREALEKEMDDKERMFNALTGDGPYTDAEALGRGKLSTEEYVTRGILREQEIDKRNK